MADREVLLQVKDLSKSFGGVEAVRSVSVSIDRGETVALVGDNGAGKSTLVKMISGALIPDAGTIWFDGANREFRTPHDALESGIETMYQDLSLIPSLGAPANIFLGREPLSATPGIRFLKHKQMDYDAAELLERLGIELPSSRIQVELLSGGQRQAVALAKAFAKGDPKLLVMDEPTAALGVEEQSKVLDLIRRLKESTGVTVMVISHNLDHVLAVSERVLVMKNGELVADLQKAHTNKSEIAQTIVTGKLEPATDGTQGETHSAT